MAFQLKGNFEPITTNLLITLVASQQAFHKVVLRRLAHDEADFIYLLNEQEEYLNSLLTSLQQTLEEQYPSPPSPEES